MIGKIRDWCEKCHGTGFIGEEFDTRVCKECNHKGYTELPWSREQVDALSTFFTILDNYDTLGLEMDMPDSAWEAFEKCRKLMEEK